MAPLKEILARLNMQNVILVCSNIENELSKRLEELDIRPKQGIPEFLTKMTKVSVLLNT